jgi:hypothetical protein
MKKQRSEANTLAQVSLSRELLAKSKVYARSREMPWATWVRSLILNELEAEAKRAGSPQALIAPAGATAVESGGKNKPPTRKCRGGKHCAIPKAVNS